MRGESKQMLQNVREKNKVVYQQAVRRERKEKETMGQDLDYLQKHDKKFNPVD